DSLAPSQTEDKILKIHIYLADGSHFQREAIAGLRLLDLLRMYGFPVKAECGGACVCGTCHIRVHERWQHARTPSSVGDVLLDQIQLMLRAGFTSFEINSASTIRALEAASLPAVSRVYQASAKSTAYR